MKKKIFLTLMVIVLTMLVFSVICVSANEEDIRVYNKDAEVVFSHNVFNYNEQYYLHIDDLCQLGLRVDEDNNTYTITSNDCLGEEGILVIKPLTIITGAIISPVNELMSFEEDSITVDKVTCSGTYKCRSVRTIGYATDITYFLGYEDSFSGNTDVMIKVDGELYISAQFIGSKLSHKYSLENNRMDFYIANDSATIMETTVNLVKGTVAPLGGHHAKIYTAYKIGEGNTMDNFEVLSSCDCIIQENESSATCLIETPDEKIGDSNLYFVVDLGERYAPVYSEFDFSKVGRVLVYGQQKDVTYTVDLELPESAEQDVPFTVYVEADNKTYSKKGVVEGRQKSVVFEFEGLPVAKNYNTRIEFDYHKYKNAILEDFELWNIAYAKDFRTDFTAEYSRTVVCSVSLPDDFIPNGDVEVKVQLSKYIRNGSLNVVNNLTDWTDSKIVTLNNEKRSEQICLYSQASSSKLSYTLISGGDGLCQNGYLHIGGKITSDSNLSKEIREELVAEMKLLQKKKIVASVFRPFSLSVENDIYASVVLDDISTSLISDVMLDFTQTPLIPSGERKSQFEFEIAEDKLYTLKIVNITGDNRLFDYYCYSKAFDSPADEGKKWRIGFSNDSINIALLQCNNITGTVECEKMDLNFDVMATCNLYNGEIIRLTSDVENGEFSFKIPEDTDTYTLDVQTRIGKKSYYVSDGISTNNGNEATEILFEYNDDRDIVLEYILQNPLQPIEISTKSKYDYFILENVSDYLIEEYDAYVAYYDKHGSLMCVDKTGEEQLISGLYFKLPRDTANYKIKKAKAFTWKKGGLTPLSNVSEINVNQPDIPEQNMSVFKIGDSNAVINCKDVNLSKSPEVINDTMYISATDFEKLGYKVIADETEVYIEKDQIKYKFTFGEYTAVQLDNNITYKITAPILSNDEILVPLAVISDLFGEKIGWHDIGQILIINMPFYDIEYTDLFCEAILEMYNKGVLLGYEDGSFQPEQTVYRSEAGRYFSRTMGHDGLDYDFECSDVSSEHWAKSWIGICVNENVFELEDDKFRPNDNITLEEAIIAAIKMKGESSENYLEIAKTNGLLMNINEENVGRNITRAEMAQLLYNATK